MTFVENGNRAIERIKPYFVGAAFDLSIGFAVNFTASQVSTNVAENFYMTESSPGDKSFNQPAGNLAYIEPLQVMHYGGGTWRMVTR